MAKDQNKITAARLIYTRFNVEARLEKLGKNWRKAVIAEIVEKLGGPDKCSVSSAATMFNTIRKESGGKSTKRVPKQPKAVEQLEVRPRDENGKRVGFVLVVNGAEFAMTTQLNKSLVKSIGVAEEAPVAPAPPPPVAKEKGKPGRKPDPAKAEAKAKEQAEKDARKAAKALTKAAKETNTEGKPHTWQVNDATGKQTATFTSRDAAREAAKAAGEGYTASKIEVAETAAA